MPRPAPCAAPGCAPSSHAILSEIVYDATGDDTGKEFVELYNPFGHSLPLAGARLEAGDGAGPGRWTVRWTGTASDSIAPGARFVIGGALVTPLPQAVIELALQNGPDAVRMVWPDGAVEVLGYGALAYAEYFCGAPAADVAGGQSLARVPDNADLGSNALDFRAATPTPGRPNVMAHDASVVPGMLAIDPPQPDAGVAATLTAAIANSGTDAIAAGDAAVEVSEPGQPLGAAPAPTLAAGETARVVVTLPALAAGAYLLRAHVAWAADERPDDDVDSVRVRVGPGPLAVTEIQFHPTHGEGEWVEVMNRSGAPLDPSQFTLADRSGAPGIPAATALLPPESLGVFVSDRPAWLTRFPLADTARVWAVHPWDPLNNSNGDDGIADMVIVRERDGTPDQRVSFSATGVPAGVPLELREGVWQPARDPLGTPLALPPPLPPMARHFDLHPRRVAPGGTIACAWSLPWPASCVVDVYDLAGRRVARPFVLDAGARGEQSVSLAGIEPGTYVATLRARGPSGAQLVESRALRIEGRAP